MFILPSSWTQFICYSSIQKTKMIIFLELFRPIYNIFIINGVEKVVKSQKINY